MYNYDSRPRDIIRTIARERAFFDDVKLCYNIMYVFHKVDGDKFLQYYNELSQNCDHMSAHRVEVLVKEIIKGCKTGAKKLVSYHWGDSWNISFSEFGMQHIIKKKAKEK